MPTDVVYLTALSFVEREINTFHTVLDVEPATHIFTATIERYVLSCEQVGKKKWNEFLLVLSRTVVVREARNHDVEPKGAIVCEDEHVGACL